MAVATVGRWTRTRTLVGASNVSASGVGDQLREFVAFVDRVYLAVADGRDDVRARRRERHRLEVRFDVVEDRLVDRWLGFVAAFQLRFRWHVPAGAVLRRRPVCLDPICYLPFYTFWRRSRIDLWSPAGAARSATAPPLPHNRPGASSDGRSALSASTGRSLAAFQAG